MLVYDADGNIVGPGDIGRQLAKSLENVATALGTVGASLDQVGAFTLYIKQSHMKEGKAIVAADITPVDDARGSADYRRHIVDVVARRSLAQLFGLTQEQP